MSKGGMTSKERMLGALRCEAVDHVPCAPWFFGNHVAAVGRQLSTRELLAYLTQELDADAFIDCFDNDPGTSRRVGTGLSRGQSPSVTAKFWTSDSGTILHKVFHTPSGDLSASIRDHESIPEKDDIPLSCDYNGPVFVKPWIETIEDVECFKHLCCPPDKENIAAFHETFQETKRLADEFGVATVGHVGMGLTLLIQMMGGEGAVMASVDNPDLVHRFMDIEHETNMKQLEILLEAGVDIICRNGFYETCDFWSPKQVQEFVLPRVNEEARCAHSADGVLTYTVCTGIEPLLDLYRQSEIDCFQKFDTKLMGQSLGPIAEKLAVEKCLWGGVSDCVDLGQATPDETCQAVREAFEKIGPRGMILAAGPSIKPERPVENINAMFREWRKLRNTYKMS